MVTLDIKLTLMVASLAGREVRRTPSRHSYLTPLTCLITSVPNPKYTIVTMKSVVYPK